MARRPGKDIEEKNNVAAAHPEIVAKLGAIAEKAHEPIRPGVVHDRVLIEKDRRQAPHQRRSKK